MYMMIYKLFFDQYIDYKVLYEISFYWRGCEFLNLFLSFKFDYFFFFIDKYIGILGIVISEVIV